MASVDITYEAPPTLGRFLGCDTFVRGVIGPVGSGKSSACAVELLRRACEQVPGPDGKRRTRFAVIRNTYPQLRDTTRKTFEQWIPEKLGVWREQEFTFELKFKDVRSEIMFRALDRPQDVKKLLSLELTGAWLNEGREIPRSIFDMLQTRVGRYPSRAQGGCTWRGIWLDSNPWAKSHWGYQLFTRHKNLKPEHRALYTIFEQPGGLSPEAENIENLEPGYYDRLTAGKDSEWIKSYVDGQYPDVDQGSIWGVQMALLEARGGICEYDHPMDGVFTSWDLGISDSTAIWFWRVGRDSVPDVIDHYEAHGEALSHFFDVLDTKGYQYVKHWLPHDARNRTMQTGVGILDLFIERYGAGAVAIGPELSLVSGIQAGRWLLEQPVRIHSRCESGIEALNAYHYTYDEATQDYSRTPEHDWASHSADAWRYLACVAKASERMTRKGEPAKPKPILPLTHSFTLDQLWEEHERGRV